MSMFHILSLLLTFVGTGIAQSVQRLAAGLTVSETNPGDGEILYTRPVRPWGPPYLLYDGYRLSFPATKRPGRDVDYPPPSTGVLVSP
jgi:hypothetical protein